KISPMVNDCRRGRPLECSTSIARGKSPSAIRTSQPFLSADRFLSAWIPAPSSAAITWLACCSSRLLYSAEPLQPASARQASSRTIIARRLFAFDAFMPPPVLRLLPEQLLHAIGRAVGDVGCQLRLEQQLVGFHRQRHHFAGRGILVAVGDRLRQRLDLLGA